MCRARSLWVARLGALSLLRTLASRLRHRILLGAYLFRLQQKPRHRSFPEGRRSSLVLVSGLIALVVSSLLLFRLVMASGRLSISPLLPWVGVVLLLLPPGRVGARTIRIGLVSSRLPSRLPN